jgi:uncharacterized membrane protein YkvA (DUF1232 family)
MEPQPAQGLPSQGLPSQQQRALEDELFNRASRVDAADAERAMRDIPDKLATVVESVNQKTPGVKTLIANVKMLYTMLRDNSFTISWSAKAIIVAAFLYFISPIDIIPDFIPLLGYVDDAFVISAALNAVTGEIERYKAYRAGTEKVF